MCVCFFCRLVESKVKNWTFSWFQLRNEFWLLPTSNQRFKFDGKEKTTPKFRQKVQNFHQKFDLYDWWQESLTSVWVYENFEVFCILDGNSQVWAINHHLRKTVLNFFQIYTLSKFLRGMTHQHECLLAHYQLMKKRIFI